MRVRKHRATRATRSQAKPALAGAALISYAYGVIVARTANARQYSLCQLVAGFATTQLNLMSQAEQTLAAGDLSRSLPGV